MVYYKKPMHEQGAFAGICSHNYADSDTGMLCDSVLSLPMGPYINRVEVHKICKCLMDNCSYSGKN